MLKSGLILFFLLIVWTGSGQEVFQKEIYYGNDTSKLKEVIHFTIKDTLMHGSYESFHLNGSLQTIGYFRLGIPDSTWIYYFENGRKRAEGAFRGGRAYNKWAYYYENGSKKSEGYLQDDIKHGSWTFFYENGNQKSTGTYYYDKKAGIWNYFYEDEVLKAQAYFEEGIGVYKEFYPSGGLKMEGKNEDEKSVGDWKYYYESGELQATGRFEDGLRVGEWKYYHTNGKISAIGTFTAGKETGIWKHYYQDGRVSAEGSMDSGEKDGFWKLYYPTGELKGEGDFEIGDGEYTEYYPNGTRRTSGRIVSGKKYGKWTFYTEEGLIDGEAMYHDDEGLYTGFYPNGTLKMKGVMSGDRRIGDWELYNPDGSLAGTYKPIYEDEAPIFKTRQSPKLTDPTGSEKPDYVYKNKRLRYFTPVINEYEGVIIAANPLAVAVHRLPIALEYYRQERLGYELQFVIFRNPFFTSNSKIPLDDIYTRGGTIEFRQKFYHADKKLGMWYFGHQIGFNALVHSVTILDNNFFEDFGQLNENRMYYGVVIGNRWVQNTSDSGFTIDAYLGIGAGIRSYTTNYSDNGGFALAFSDVIKNKGYFPILFGINIGHIGPKRRITK
jgi:antitoxin component YwqK of YwqJK toxin-antitoxin module